MAIFRGPGGAGDATADVTNEAATVALAVTAAEDAQAAAELAQANAETAETNAETYATSASASLTSVINLASAAETYSITALNAASAASVSLVSVIDYASAAEVFSITASNAASAAAVSSVSAAGYASASETYSVTSLGAASAATVSAASASASAVLAIEAYDSFDDRYLGAKSSVPATDNDGDALVTGALYYNTSANQLYIWNGAAWDQAAFNASGSVISFNTRTGAVTLSSADVTTALGFTPLQTETDPVVGAITGIVKANGAGTISAAVSGTDYQAPLTAGTDYLAPAAIGVTVQGYDADTAKYDDATANFTGTLQNGGNNVLTSASDYLDSADIGVSVQGYDADTAKLDVAQTFTAQQTFGELKETTYTLGTTGSIALDPANGSIQSSTLSGDPTFTDSLEAGQVVVLMLNGGASYTVTWPTITWVTSDGDVAPTLTANDTLVFWKVSTTLYGAYVGSYA